MNPFHLIIGMACGFMLCLALDQDKLYETRQLENQAIDRHLARRIIHDDGTIEFKWNEQTNQAP